LSKTPVIKKIAAIFLLIVFAFSITPTVVFHNWLADHTDTCKKSSNTKGQQFGKKTFNCHCDTIVAESPFTETASFLDLPVIQVFPVATADAIVYFPSAPAVFYSLRGPPAV